MPTDEEMRRSPLPLAIPTDGVTLTARLVAPAGARAVVVLATAADERPLDVPSHWLVSCLGEHGLGVLTVGLLGASERSDARRRFDVFLLARRLEATAAHLHRHFPTGLPRMGYLGEGTAAAGALLASLDAPRVHAVISWRGRPELAEGILHRVSAPTLFMTDPKTADASMASRRHLRCPSALASADEVEAAMSGRGRRDDEVVSWLSRHLALSASGRSRAGTPARHPPIAFESGRSFGSRSTSSPRKAGATAALSRP